MLGRVQVGGNICGDRAEAILARMIENGHKPDRITFNSIIKAWSSAREPHKAEQYLKKMEAEYEAGDKNISPDARAYASCINAWANSCHKQSGDRAEQLLHRQWELFRRSEKAEARPDFITVRFEGSSRSSNGHGWDDYFSIISPPPLCSCSFID